MHVRQAPDLLLQLMSESLAEVEGTLSQILVLQNLQSLDSNRATHGVAAVGGPVLPRLDLHHDVVVAKGSADRVHAAAQRLAEHKNVGLDVVVVARQHAPSPRKPGLDLIPDPEHIVLSAQIADPLNVPLSGHANPSLSLDGLYVIRADVGVSGKLLLQSLQIVIRNAIHTRHVRAKAILAIRISGRRDRSQCSAPEIALGKQDTSLIVGNPLDVVAPSTGKLARCFPSLDTTVHGQDLVVSEHGSEVLGELGVLVVPESARRQRNGTSLLSHHLHQPWVAMSLVHRRVGRQEIKIPLAIRIPHKDSLSLGQHRRNGVVVVRPIAKPLLDQLLRSRHGELSSRSEQLRAQRTLRNALR
mmetsp:Transcript_13686/g.31105  ORF Transcript_13686/g.31105 Transcript_13686/m.31105 type:complete len:358 (+) Transcript_13686:671-1744(+)